MASKNPKTQKDLGRQVKGLHGQKWDASDRAFWENAVPDILVRAGLAKFSQNPDILEYLLSTAPKTLVEGSPSDRIYGVGLRYDDTRIEDEANWQGQNLLGKANEIVRTRLTPQSRNS